MSTITFDTLHFVSTLEKAGFDRKQAEGLALAQKEAPEPGAISSDKTLRVYLYSSAVACQVSPLRASVIW